MTSPDLPTPVSLALHAVNENDLVDAAIAAFQVSTPEWVPQEGATEVVLMESLSLLVGQQVYALNQLPRVVLDGLIAIRGITRHPAVVSAGTLLITLAVSTVGTRVVPIGARFQLPLDVGTVDIVASETLSINPTDGLTATLHVQSALPGTAANGVPVTTIAAVTDAMQWMQSAVVNGAMGGGANAETDIAFYSRAAAIMQRSNAALVIDSQFAAAALDVTGVGRAAAWGLWDGAGSPGTAAGHITIAVAAPDGSNVTSGIKASVLSLLTADAVAGLTVHVIDFTTVAMAISLTYVLAAGFDAATVTAAIRTELMTWLSPGSWPLGQQLTSANQIVLRIGQVQGVNDITTLTGWSAVTGTATLPSVTSVTITQT